jgi:hypothetical protein
LAKAVSELNRAKVADVLALQWKHGFGRTGIPRGTPRFTHGTHPYPAGMSVALARSILPLLEIPNDGIVLDPFMGAGTVLIEASALGYRTVGIDVSPLAAFIATHQTWLGLQREGGEDGIDRLERLASFVKSRLASTLEASPSHESGLRAWATLNRILHSLVGESFESPNTPSGSDHSVNGSAVNSPTIVVEREDVHRLWFCASAALSKRKGTKNNNSHTKSQSSSSRQVAGAEAACELFLEAVDQYTSGVRELREHHRLGRDQQHDTLATVASQQQQQQAHLSCQQQKRAHLVLGDARDASDLLTSFLFARGGSTKEGTASTESATSSSSSVDNSSSSSNSSSGSSSGVGDDDGDVVKGDTKVLQQQQQQQQQERTRRQQQQQQLVDAVLTSPPYPGVYDYVGFARESRELLTRFGDTQGRAVIEGNQHEDATTPFLTTAAAGGVFLETAVPQGRNWPSDFHSQRELGAYSHMKRAAKVAAREVARTTTSPVPTASAAAAKELEAVAAPEAAEVAPTTGSNDDFAASWAEGEAAWMRSVAAVLKPGGMMALVLGDGGPAAVAGRPRYLKGKPDLPQDKDGGDTDGGDISTGAKSQRGQGRFIDGLASARASAVESGLFVEVSCASIKPTETPSNTWRKAGNRPGRRRAEHLLLLRRSSTPVPVRGR